MNINKLVKRATPTPILVVKVPQPQFKKDGNRYQLIGKSVSVPGKIRVIAEANGPWEPDSYAADMALLAHCRNNFMRALDALKRLAAITDREFPITHRRNPDNDGTDKLIKELEEVKL